MAAAARAFQLRDKYSRCICSRRCSRRLESPCGCGRRRRFGHDPFGSPISADGLEKMQEHSTEEIMARLEHHKWLGSAPAAEHAWLAAHGTWRTLSIGDVLVPGGTPSPNLNIVFEGDLVIRADRGA